MSRGQRDHGRDAGRRATTENETTVTNDIFGPVNESPDLDEDVELKRDPELNEDADLEDSEGSDLGRVNFGLDQETA